jgi:hypothetical protein
MGFTVWMALNLLKAKSAGGGCSLMLTRLCLEIPVNREIYREFIGFLRQFWRTDTAICHIQFG